MRFATAGGRAHVNVGPEQYIDLAKASDGLLPSDPQACLERWNDVVSWAAATAWSKDQLVTLPDSALDAPVGAPGQIFAVGLNYSAHAEETALTGNTQPLTFTKFRSSIAAPRGDVGLPTDTVDWEVELVAVIGRHAHHIPEAEGWSVVAGLTLGQDLSERTGQMTGQPPQFSLAKSYPGFAPLGPHLVTLDSFENLDDIALECRVNGEVVQSGSTRHLIHSIPELISFYSSICPLSPGDLIFTGTPDGVGFGRQPAIYLRDGDELVTSSPQIGQMVHRCRRAAVAGELRHV